MTTVASASTWLAAHIGKHRLIVLDATHVRCIDCQQTGVLGPTQPDPDDPRSSITLPVPGAVQTTRGRREIPNLRDPNACQEHPGYWADNCGPCRADRIALDNVPTVQADPITHADPRDNPEWRALRDRLRNPK